MKKYQFWFCTGSQDLYGDECLEHVAQHSKVIVEELNKSDVQLTVVDRWNELFKETKYKPIDIHTPLWLWSRNGFKEVK